MTRIITTLALAALLSACGLAETAATDAAAGASAAEQAREARRVEDKVRDDVNAMQQQATEARKAAEAAATE